MIFLLVSETNSTDRLRCCELSRRQRVATHDATLIFTSFVHDQTNRLPRTRSHRTTLSSFLLSSGDISLVLGYYSSDSERGNVSGFYIIFFASRRLRVNRYVADHIADLRRRHPAGAGLRLGRNPLRPASV